MEWDFCPIGQLSKQALTNQNMKEMFDDRNCRACGLEEESQKHIIQDCIKLSKNRGDMNVKYEKLFNGTVSEKLMIAKIFKENYEIVENMKKWKQNEYLRISTQIHWKHGYQCIPTQTYNGTMWLIGFIKSAVLL